MVDTQRLRSWIDDEALPLWAGTGFDRDHGGFAERLTLAGAPADDDYKRMRVQARQIFVYSHAAVHSRSGPALTTARHGYAFLTRHCWHADGGWIFSTRRDGRPLDTVREAYEQAFGLYALAWFYRASGDSEALDWVRRTLDFMDARLAEPVHGGYRESIPDKLPRRQNPHMHLLEACLALFEATGDAAYLDRARRLVALFQTRFLHADSGTLGEYFTADWQPAAGDAGERVEPGHHFEWVWLLHQYQRLTGDDVAAAADTLYRFAEAHGTDAADGLAFDCVRRDGTADDTNKRLWPQTEAIKAQVARYEATADQAAADRLQTLLDTVFRRYLGAGPGYWIDQTDRAGTGLVAYAPASTFYHLYLAFSEVLRVFQPAPYNEPAPDIEPTDGTATR